MEICIDHNSNNFTIIDSYLSEENKITITDEIMSLANNKEITRFISTHPGDDHIGGLDYLDEKLNIRNFYCVKNEALIHFTHALRKYKNTSGKYS